MDASPGILVVREMDQRLGARKVLVQKNENDLKDKKKLNTVIIPYVYVD